MISIDLVDNIYFNIYQVGVTEIKFYIRLIKLRTKYMVSNKQCCEFEIKGLQRIEIFWNVVKKHHLWKDQSVCRKLLNHESDISFG